MAETRISTSSDVRRAIPCSRLVLTAFLLWKSLRKFCTQLLRRRRLRRGRRSVERGHECQAADADLRAQVISQKERVRHRGIGNLGPPRDEHIHRAYLEGSVSSSWCLGITRSERIRSCRGR